MWKLIALFVVVAGCGKDPSPTGADAKRAMGLYAEGFNALLGDPNRLIDGYFQAGDRPSLTSPSFAADRITQARQAFAAADDAAPPSLALVEPAARALAASERAVAIYSEAYRYYQAGRDRDDGGAGGRAIDQRLQQARRELSTALDSLASGMEHLEDAQAADEIAKRVDDKDYGYWFRYYTQQAKRFVVALHDLLRKPVAESATKLTRLAGELESVDRELAAFVAAKGTSLSRSFAGFHERAGDFRAAVDKLVRAIRTDAPLERTPDDVITAYNGLVTVANALAQVEAVGNLKDE